MKNGNMLLSIYIFRVTPDRQIMWLDNREFSRNRHGVLVHVRRSPSFSQDHWRLVTGTLCIHLWKVYAHVAELFCNAVYGSSQASENRTAHDLEGISTAQYYICLSIVCVHSHVAHDVRRRQLRSHSQECKATVLHILAYGLEFIVKILHRRLIRPRKVLCDKFRPLLKCNPHPAHRRPSILLVPLHLVLVVSHNGAYPSCYTKKN